MSATFDRALELNKLVREGMQPHLLSPDRQPALAKLVGEKLVQPGDGVRGRRHVGRIFRKELYYKINLIPEGSYYIARRDRTAEEVKVCARVLWAFESWGHLDCTSRREHVVRKLRLVVSRGKEVEFLSSETWRRRYEFEFCLLVADAIK